MNLAVHGLLFPTMLEQIDIPELISNLGTVFKVKDLIYKIIPKKNGVQKAFTRAIKGTAKKLERKHGKKIFGGSAESILLKQIDLIFKSFEQYGHLSNLQDDLVDEIHFIGLPDGFYEDFKSFLIQELEGYQQTKQILVEYLKTLQIDQTHKYASLLPEMDNKLDLINGSLSQLLGIVKRDSQPFNSVRHKYKNDVPYFIERELLSCSEKQLEEHKTTTLVSLVEKGETQRIALINYAGNGKSGELDHLAWKLSSEESIFEPIMLSLGQIDLKHNSIEGYLNKVHPGWGDLKSNLVLIIDALDEVGSDSLPDVMKQILTAASLAEQSTIVVSCRTNLYHLNRNEGNGNLDGFAHYELPPFNEQDVWGYLIRRFSNADLVDKFLAQVRKLGFREDITTPFYLVKLCDYYGQNEKLPNSKKELFEELIKQLKTKERLGPPFIGELLDENEEELDLAIGKIACVLQITEENYLESTELLKTVNSKEIAKLLKRCYLLDNGSEGKWRFEHNNFKEYLSAKFMARKGFDFIKANIFIPKVNKIKPIWLNTLGFIIGYLDDKSPVLAELVTFIEAHDPQSLVRAERDKIELDIRENIFFNLIAIANGKGIYPRSVKFSTEDLGDFVSDSEKVCQYLVEQIDSKNEKTHIDLSAYLLERNQHWESYNKEIQKRLAEIIYNKGVEPRKRKNAIDALKWFNVYDKDLMDYMLNHMIIDEKMKREAIYHHLVHTEHVEEYIEFMIDAFMQDNYCDHFSYELLPNLTSEKSFVLALKKLSKDEHNYGHYEELLAQLFTEMKKRSLYSEELTNASYIAFKAHDNFHRRSDLRDSLFQYSETGNLTDQLFRKAFQEYSDSENDKAVFALPVFFGKGHPNYILKEIEQKNWDDKKIKSFRNILNWTTNEEAFNYFYSRLNERYSNKFIWENTEDPYTKSLECQVNLLFDKPRFLELTSALFSSKNMTRHQLYNLEDFDRDNPEKVACRNILGQIIHDGVWSFNQLQETISAQRDWEFLIVICLHSLIKASRKVVGTKEEYFLQNWSQNELNLDSFERTFFIDESKKWSYNSRGLYAAGICQYYQLQLTREQSLSLLNVDSYRVRYVDGKVHHYDQDLSDSELLKYVIAMVEEREVEDTIVMRLKKNLMIPEIRKNHLKYLRRKELTQYKDFFLSEENGKLSYQYLIWYLELGGEVKIALDKLETYKDYDKRQVMDAIIKRDKFILRDYLIDEIQKTENEDNKAINISKLLDCGDEKGLNFLRKWILRNKRFPGNTSIILAVNIQSTMRLPILKEIYLDSIRNSYGNDHSFYDRRSCLENLVKLGLDNKDSYDDVQSFLKETVDKYPEMKMLYGEIDSMEYNFYKNKTYSLGFDKALDLVNAENPLANL